MSVSFSNWHIAAHPVGTTVLRRYSTEKATGAHMRQKRCFFCFLLCFFFFKKMQAAEYVENIKYKRKTVCTGNWRSHLFANLFLSECVCACLLFVRFEIFMLVYYIHFVCVWPHCMSGVAQHITVYDFSLETFGDSGMCRGGLFWTGGSVNQSNNQNQKE